MSITLQLSDESHAILQQVFGQDLPRAAYDALILEGYRSGRPTQYQVQRLLGFDNTWDTQEWLGSHGAHVQYSIQNLQDDGETLKQVQARMI